MSRPTIVSPTVEHRLPRRALFLQLAFDRAGGEGDSELEAALQEGRPEIQWRQFESNGKSQYQPVVPLPASAKVTDRVDIAIFGNELEAVCTAVAAAKRGFSVALVSDGPLGGLCSDEGGNLRYFDGMPGTPRTPAQLEAFRALGMEGLVAIPPGVTPHLTSWLKSRYPKSIKLIPVQSLDGLVVQQATELSGVLTDTGHRIVANDYLDMDAEGRVGELCGLLYDPITPSLAYGLVFDLLHLSDVDYTALRDRKRLNPREIMHLTRVDEATVEASKGLITAKKRLVSGIRKDRTLLYSNASFGYLALGAAYDFYMRCRAAKDSSPALKWCNDARAVSGFNVSRFTKSANFNSISYRLPNVVLQGDHSLTTDPTWKPIIEAEGPGLRDFFRYVTGDRKVTVRLPAQFYVRRSTCTFTMPTTYSAEDFVGRPRTKWWMSYDMDYRDVRPRPGFDDALFTKIGNFQKMGPPIRFWDCNPATAGTRIPNFYMINKCAVPGEFSGGLRILQNLVNTGQAWVESLPVPVKTKR